MSIMHKHSGVGMSENSRRQINSLLVLLCDGFVGNMKNVSYLSFSMCQLSRTLSSLA